MEDRYNDDGTLSSEDQQSFSLRTGHTQAMMAVQDGVPTGAKATGVSENELIDEMKGGRGLVLAALGVGVIIIVAIVLIFAI